MKTTTTRDIKEILANIPESEYESMKQKIDDLKKDYEVKYNMKLTEKDATSLWLVFLATKIVFEDLTGGVQ